MTKSDIFLFFTCYFFIGVLKADSGCSRFFSSLAFFVYMGIRYESSGYEYTSSPQTYTSYRQVYTSSPQVNTTSAQNSLFKSNLSYNSEPENQPNGSQNPDSSIESGPSFNESLQRFKTASGHNSQMANWKSQMSSRTQSSHVQRRVEETRTMITQSSQKSYHIE